MTKISISIKLYNNVRHFVSDKTLDGWTVTYDKVSAVLEVSLPQASYYDVPQIGAKSKFFRLNYPLSISILYFDNTCKQTKFALVP